MTRTSEVLRHIIRREFRPKAPSGAEATAVAAAAAGSYELLARPLARLIGQEGVSAIHARSMHLTKQEFPWLAPELSTEGSHPSVQQLRRMLEGQQPGVILLAAEALAVNFTDLLVTLIGEPLTTRLLQEAWPGGFIAETAQETSE